MAYAAIKLSGREIVRSSDIKEKDDQITRFEKLYEMQDDIDADFLFEADKDKSMDAMAAGLAGSEVRI